MASVSPSAPSPAGPSHSSDASDFKPYIPASEAPRELTFRGILIGSILGIVFAASSVYLGLKVGLTVSASIPVAVLSITLFRWAAKAFNLKRASILENNIVQTTGSAGESIAAGVAFTLPSLLLMGFDMELVRVMLVGLLGGLIGVLMMIPLRHGLIVKEHGKLAFPEGTACADVLIVGEQGGTNAKTVFLGFGIGFFYTFLNLVTKLWADTSSFAVDMWGRLKGATVAFEVSPTMLGVGYIIGPRTSANMLAGGALAFLVLVPLIHFFGDGITSYIYPAADLYIRDMSPGQIRSNYILFIGAGAVATGGFIALARAIPTIIAAFRRGMGSMGKGEGTAASRAAALPRTERDLSMKWVLGGSGALALAIALAPVLNINPLSAVLIVVFGFFFVTVSSRITGEIGSSSNPISGMTVATLLLTCGLFVAIGWTGVDYKAMALTTAALVCVAASNGGTIAQDLKTGHLVGATPRHQQVSILVGVVASAIVIGFTILLLNDSATTFRAISHPGMRLPAAAITTDAMKGPDGAEYKIAYLQEETAGLARGKYLVDAAGEPTFLVDPGVCGTYPYKLEKPKDALTLAAATDAPTELGVDRKPYKVVDLESSIAAHPPGRYLVDKDGRAAWRDDGGKWVAFGGGAVLPVAADAAEAKAPSGDNLRVVALAAPLTAARAGHYLVEPSGAVIYEASDKVLKYDAPKAQLFRLIIDGTLGGQLPWGLVLIGVFLAFMMELVGVSALPFAVGLYLPISTSGGIFVGGLVRWFVDKRRKTTAAEAEFSPGMLMASGLIAGGAIAGVGQAIFEGAGINLSLSGALGDLANNEDWWPLMWFMALAGGLLWVALKAKSPGGHSAPAATDTASK